MYENVDAEKNTVGAMMLNAGTVSNVMQLNEADFTDPKCRIVFKSARALYEKGDPIDITTLGTYIADKKLGVQPSDLLKMASYVPATANVSTYIKRIRECTERRKLRNIGLSIINHAEADDIAETIAKAGRELGTIGSIGGDWMTMAEMMVHTFDRMEAVSRGELKSIGTGISILDQFFTGFFPGELTILAARPAVGKSAFGLFIALNAARNGHRVAIVSREMSPEAIGQRVMSNCSKKLTGTMIRTGKLEPDDWEIAGDVINEMSRLPVYSIYNTRCMEDLHQKVRELKDREGLDLLIVDYAQLMHMSRRIESRTEELEEVSASLKEIAIDLSIPVLALAQVKRSGARTAVMPTMDELKGSGSFEQDADNIMLMHRPEEDSDPFINPNERDIRKSYMAHGLQYIVIRVAKQRQGETVTVSMCFDPAHTKYTGVYR